MTELVVIQFAGKEYIGQVGLIDAEFQQCVTFGQEPQTTLKRYRVTLIEKDTNCEISNIFVNSLFDIKPYVEPRYRYEVRVHSKATLPSTGEWNASAAILKARDSGATYEAGIASDKTGVLTTTLSKDEILSLGICDIVRELQEEPK